MGAEMIRYSTFSDKGGREVNEDKVGFTEQDGRYCFVLCDGLGGHGMGDVASLLVCESILGTFKEGKYGSYTEFLKQAFENAQGKLLEEQDRLSAKNKMKTTCVILTIDKAPAGSVISGDEAGDTYIGFIGDSRLYVFNDNEVVKRTLDHSVPQRLALAGQIMEKEIRNHPDRNKVLCVLGTEWEKPGYELLKPMAQKEIQAFLLCSDGFWEGIEEKEMCHLLKKSDSPEEWLEQMVARIKKNNRKTLDKMDNYSAIAVWVE